MLDENFKESKKILGNLVDFHRDPFRLTRKDINPFYFIRYSYKIFNATILWALKKDKLGSMQKRKTYTHENSPEYIKQKGKAHSV